MNVHVSPSLQLGGSWAYEVKFAVDFDNAERILDWAQRVMQIDVNGEAAYGGAYRIHTLYLDTAGHDVYHRNPGYRVSKFRLRQYGKSPEIFVEQKRKRDRRVMKKRTPITANDIGLIGTPVSLVKHPHDWFRLAIARRNLVPTTIVSYTRNAFNAMTEFGPARLTVDHDIYALAASGWAIGEVFKGVHLNPDKCILEMKFSDQLPEIFDKLVREFGLLQAGMSKYRLSHCALEKLPIEEEKQCKSC